MLQHLTPPAHALPPSQSRRTQRSSAVASVAAASKAVLLDTPMEVDTAPGYSLGGRGRGRGRGRGSTGRGRGGGGRGAARDVNYEQPQWAASAPTPALAGYG